MNRMLWGGLKFATSRQVPNTIFSIFRGQQVFKSTPTNPGIKRFSINLDANTAVIKDVVLFKYENPRLFKAMGFFAIAQFFFWNWLSYFSFNNLKDAPVDKSKEEDLPLWRRINLGENKYRNGIGVMCFLMGYGILMACWMFTLKSVRMLILRQGGQVVTFVTYTPFGVNRMMDVPLKFISAEESRQMARTLLPVKVKNRALYYVLDVRGEFKNPQLFDQTVGIRRNLGKK